MWTTFLIASFIFCCNGEDICVMIEKYQKVKSTFQPYLAQKDKLCGALYKAEDCKDILTSFPSTPSGVFTMYPADGQDPVTAYCDMTTDGGGWLVFQRRIDGSEDFYRDWHTYMEGFGNVSHEFWLGNAALHRITSQHHVELRIDVEDYSGHRDFAKYSSFAIGNMASYFNLSVSGFTGSDGDPLHSQNGMKFSAYDLDLDTSSANCAKAARGGWWFSNCGATDLNGVYGDRKTIDVIHWNYNNTMPLKSVVMMIRPVA